MATAATEAPRTRITSTTVRETIPPTESATPSEFYDRDFWEVIGSLTDQQWKEHLVRVYRADDRWERAGSPPGNKLEGKFGEETIFERWGGGRYKLWLYGPPNGTKVVMRPFNLELEGAPKAQTMGAVGSAPVGDENSVALKALSMMNNPELMRLMMQMYVTASTEAMGIIKAQIPVAQNPLETLRAAKEILGGGSDQKSSLVETIHLLKDLGIIGGQERSAISETVKVLAELKGAGLLGGAKTDMIGSLANVLPTVFDRGVSAVREWRIGMEAQRDAVKAQTGRVIDMPPASTSPTTEAAPGAPAATAPAAVPPTPAGISDKEREEIVLHHFLSTVVDQVRNHPESTGEDMYDYLRSTLPAMVDQVKGLTTPAIIELFRTTPILTTVADHPRLPKMIDEFLAAAKADE